MKYSTQICTHLLRRERCAQGADGLGVLRRFLFQLQELGGLNQGLQSLEGSALLQVLATQPLLKLADVKPGGMQQREESS